MTISTTTSRYFYTGDGTTTDFVFGNVLFADTDIGVLLTDPDGTDIPQTLGVDYTVTIEPNFSQATVSFTTAPDGPGAGVVQKVTLYRTEPLTQTFDPIEGGPLDTDNLERAFDKLAIQNQGQQVELNRSLKFSDSYEDSGDIQVPNPEASKILGWNAAADEMINVDPGDAGVVTPGTDTVSTDSIQDDAVTTAKIADDAVTRDKIASEAVGFFEVEEDSLWPSRHLKNETGPGVIGRLLETSGDLSMLGPASVRKIAGSGPFLSGLKLINSLGDTAHDISVSAGLCLDDNFNELMELSSAIIKQIDAVWAAGTNAGGLDTGTVAADTCYAVWLIKDTGSGTVDALFSTNFTSPTLPSGYTKTRRIGFVITDGSANIIQFQQSGIRFCFDQDDTANLVVNDSSMTDGTYEISAQVGPPNAMMHGACESINPTMTAASVNYAYVTNSITAGASVTGGSAAAVAYATVASQVVNAIRGTFEVLLSNQGVFKYAIAEVSGSATMRVWRRDITDLSLAIGE